MVESEAKAYIQHPDTKPYTTLWGIVDGALYGSSACQGLLEHVVG